MVRFPFYILFLATSDMLFPGLDMACILFDSVDLWNPLFQFRVDLRSALKAKTAAEPGTMSTDSTLLLR